ncbi:hypothetical protein M8J76_007590 [Diaphorina citri]|nr:hypothetical protein M8J76_007590 [Diaphorina citri]
MKTGKDPLVERKYYRNPYINYYVRLFDQKEFKGKPAKEVAKHAGRTWNAMADNEKNCYREMAKLADHVGTKAEERKPKQRPLKMKMPPMDVRKPEDIACKLPERVRKEKHTEKQKPLKMKLQSREDRKPEDIACQLPERVRKDKHTEKQKPLTREVRKPEDIVCKLPERVGKHEQSRKEKALTREERKPEDIVCKLPERVGKHEQSRKEKALTREERKPEDIVCKLPERVGKHEQSRKEKALTREERKPEDIVCKLPERVGKHEQSRKEKALTREERKPEDIACKLPERARKTERSDEKDECPSQTTASGTTSETYYTAPEECELPPRTTKQSQKDVCSEETSQSYETSQTQDTCETYGSSETHETITTCPTSESCECEETSQTQETSDTSDQTYLEITTEPSLTTTESSEASHHEKCFPDQHDRHVTSEACARKACATPGPRDSRGATPPLAPKRTKPTELDNLNRDNRADTNENIANQCTPKPTKRDDIYALSTLKANSKKHDGEPGIRDEGRRQSVKRKLSFTSDSECVFEPRSKRQKSRGHKSDDEISYDGQSSISPDERKLKPRRPSPKMKERKRKRRHSSSSDD